MINNKMTWTMKKILWIVLAGCLFTGALGCTEEWAGEGQMTEKKFEGQRITGIDASHAWEIILKQGEETGATIEFPARFEKNIVFSLEADGTLRIGLKGKIPGHRKGEVFRAEVTCASLEDVKLSGACDLNVEGDFAGDELVFDLSGASNVDVAGNLTMREKVTLKVSGASKVKLAGVESSRFAMDASGASELVMAGKLEEGSLTLSGASEIDLSGVVMRKVSLDVSGASELSLNASELITGELSGASELKYYGRPVIEVETSGGAKLVHQD